jgi:hypothetical protein
VPLHGYRSLSGEDKAALITGRKLLEIYKSSGQDYLNFHQCLPDKSAFSEAVNYLRRVTNLPVMNGSGNGSGAGGRAEVLSAAAGQVVVCRVVQP